MFRWPDTLLRRWRWSRLVLLLSIQHLVQHIAKARSWRRSRRSLLLALIVSDCRIAALLWLLLLVLLLLLAADCAQNSANPSLGLIALLSGCAALVFISENGAQNSIGQLARIFAGGQQVLELHLRDLLNVRRHLRML